MKKYLGFLAFVFLCSLNAAAGDNILANPSFESIQPDGLPQFWGLYMPLASSSPARGDESMFSMDTSTFKEGKQSVKISSDKAVRLSIGQEKLPFIKGQKLHVKVWVKGEGLDVGSDSGAWVRLGFQNKASPTLQKTAYAASLYLKSTASTFDWQLLEGDVVIPAEATDVGFECYLWNSKGTAWFDSPSVEVIDGPPHPPGTVADPDSLQRYQKANAMLGEPKEGEPRVVFMGDSITDNWKLPTSFPSEPNFINRGIGGQKTSQMVSRFQQDVLALKPKVVWFLGGTNDLANGNSLDSIVKNIQAMVEECKQNQIHIIVNSVLPVSDYHGAQNPYFKRTIGRPPEKIIELNKKLADMCKAEGVTYLDLYSKLVDPAGQMPAGLANDGLHPNAQGYAVIAPLVDEAIHAELTK